MAREIVPGDLGVDSLLAGNGPVGGYRRLLRTALGDARMTEEPVWRRPIGRRLVLLAGGSGLLAAALPTGSPLQTLPAADATPSLTLDLLRRQDMLKLRYEFYNLQLADGRLVAVDPAQQSLIKVRFDAQHVMEQTEFVSASRDDTGPIPPPDTMPKPGTIAAKAVDPSQLVFLVPTTVKELPFTEEGLLNWTSWVMQVVPKSRVKPALYTDLLLVDWLHLTPEASSSWVHLATPLTSQGRTELWHTRLALRDEHGLPDAARGPAPVRAFDADPITLPTPYKSLIGYGSDTNVTQEIVTQTNTINPVDADLLLLSAQGSSVELAGDWPSPAPVAQWRHRSSIGRDNHVRIEQRGFLFPYGHRATVITETERTVVDGVAQFLQRAYLRVREPVKQYQDHSLPFTAVEIAMTTTPNLTASPDVVSGNTFWVQYDTATGQADVPFPMIATDWAGARSEFTAFLAFVHIEDAYDSDGLNRLRTKFSNAAFDDDAFKDGRRVHDLGGQHVAYAPPAASTLSAQDAAPADAGSTAFPTALMYLSSVAGDPLGKSKIPEVPNFGPSMLAAKVSLPAVTKLVQKEITSVIGFDPVYVAKGIEGATAQTFARVQDSVNAVGQVLQALGLPPDQRHFPEIPSEVRVAFSATVSSVGGVAVPDLNIGALSRSLGPIGGAPADIEKFLVDRTFDPRKYLATSAKLLGGVDLGQVIGANGNLLDIDNGPKIVTTPVYPGNDTTRPPSSITTTVDWKPKLPDPGKGVAFGVFLPKTDDGPASMTLHGEFHTSVGLDPKTTYTIKGDLRNFTLELVKGDDTSLHFIDLAFRRLTFETSDNVKPKLHVDIAKVGFAGPLDFVNTLEQYLVSTGDGVHIDVQPSGIEAGYTLAVPDVGVGVFSLQHLAFTAGLNLPFDGSAARARFAFCSREHPFTLAVSLFGGGGFMALALGTDGFELVEASIEFGGCVAFNLGVASGSVSVMAGIYFKLEQKDSDDIVTLSGYLRATGQLNVLGLITISAEFYLALSYTSDGGSNKVAGDASLTVEIDILFFHKSVSLSVHKEFAGPSGQRSLRAAATAAPPKFGDQLSQDDWNTYCDAFAG